MSHLCSSYKLQATAISLKGVGRQQNDKYLTADFLELAKFDFTKLESAKLELAKLKLAKLVLAKLE